MKNFQEITFHHIPIEENHMADDLAVLPSMYKVNSHDEALIIRICHRDELACCATNEEGPNNKPCFYDIKC